MIATPSSRKLYDALEETGDPRLQVIADLALTNYYHPFLSPMQMPQTMLRDELETLGQDDLVARVIAGEFNPDLKEIAEVGKIGPHIYGERGCDGPTK